MQAPLGVRSYEAGTGNAGFSPDQTEGGISGNFLHEMPSEIVVESSNSCSTELVIDK